MAAVLTLGSVAVASNGKTVTATISGGTGTGRTITNATGIFVKLSAGPVPTFPIASVGVVGSTLTITLSQPIGSGETILLDIGVGSNLTDSGANTATGQTNVAVTNGSTTAVTFYDYASGVFELGCIGEPVAIGGGWNGLRRSTILVDSVADYPVEFVTDATEFSVICLGSTATTARIDGGAQATVPADTASSWNMKPITTSALAAGKHLVLCDFGDYFMGVRVAGGTRTMYAVPTTKRTLLANTKSYVGIPQATEATLANIYKDPGAGDGSVTTSSGYVGMEVDVQIGGTGLELITLMHNGSYWSCEVDGGYAGQLIRAGEAASSSAFTYVRLAAGASSGTHTLHMTNVATGAGANHYGLRVLNGTVLTSASIATATSLLVASTTNIAVNDWVRIDNYLSREWRQVTAISGSGPYTLSVAALTNAHAIGAQVTSYSAAAGTTTAWSKTFRPRKFVAVGDSNTQGYNDYGGAGTPDSNGVYYAFYDPRTTGLYQAATALSAELVNLGIQGEASSGMAARLADYDAITDYTHGAVDAAFVWAGTNDINGTSVTPATFQTQVQTIVTGLLNVLKSGAKVYLMPPLTPTGVTNAGGLNLATALARLQAIAAANPTQVVCLDTMSTAVVSGDLNGLHYHPSGQQKIGAFLVGSLTFTGSIYLPDVTVEIAFDSGYLTPAASRTWTDVSTYVEAKNLINIQRGRPDQFSSPQPSRLSLTLDNRDGRFTPENAAGAYYPNIKKGRPIRVRVQPVGSMTTYDRFVGYIDEWPVEWPDGSEAMSTVSISATSRQARLGRTAAFKSIVEEEILYDSPVLYFPLGEPQGSTAAGNIAPGGPDVLTVTQLGVGGTLAFGAGIGPGTDSLTAPVFTPSTTVDGLYLDGSLAVPASLASGQVVDVEFFVNTTTTNRNIVDLSVGGGLLFQVFVTAAGKIQAGTSSPTFSVGSVTSAATLNDGATHHISARFALSGGVVTPSLMVDGGARTSGTTSTGWSAPLSIGRVGVGGLAGLMFDGTLAHVAVFVGSATTDARVTGHANAGLTGFSGEASGARVSRYARLSGVPVAEVSAETGLTASVAHKDTTGEQPTSLMDDVATTEDGVVFDGKDGTLTFHSRSHRYNAPSAFTLSTAAGDIEAGFQPKLDDQHLTNDMTASRPNGITVRSTNVASIAEYGYYRQSVEILTTSDNEVQSRADWEVNRFGTPRVTVPNLAVDLLTCSSTLKAALLAADIGTKFTVTGLPAQAPASTMDFFIEGVSERIGGVSYGIELNVSAAAFANVWQLDSATLSQLDSTTVLAY